MISAKVLPDHPAPAVQPDAIGLCRENRPEFTSEKTCGHALTRALKGGNFRVIWHIMGAVIAVCTGPVYTYCPSSLRSSQDPALCLVGKGAWIRDRASHAHAGGLY